MYYLFIIIFCMLGAMSRYTLDLVINIHSFPVATLVINLLGCFFLTFVMLYVIRVFKLSKELVSSLGTGFIGSFTTFSTFALESVELIQIGNYVSAAVYVSASLFGGLAACILGYRTSMMFLIHRKRRLHNGK